MNPNGLCLVCRKMGLQSLPVAFGVDTAKWITVGTIDVTQFAVAAYLFLGLKEPIYGGILTALILPQVQFRPQRGISAFEAVFGGVTQQPAISPSKQSITEVESKQKPL